MDLKLRQILGKISQVISPAYSCCGRCGITWNFVENHSTMITQSTGMFPLCEDCWSELAIKERLPYYKALYNKWGSGKQDWDNIEKAVLAGK